MSTQLLKRTLKIINQAGSDIAQYDHFIKRNISALVDSKEVASGLVSAIAHNDDQGKDDICDFLVMLLDEVRMSLENDYGYGAEFPQKIEGAIQTEKSSGSLRSEDVMRFAAIFHRAGLAVPQSLVLEPSTTVSPIDAEEIDISEFMEDLATKIEAEGGTPYDGYVGLDELLVAVPADIRTKIAHYIAASDSLFLERCALYLILSGDPDKRSAVIAGFTQKVAAQKLSPDTANFLPVIRGWFPAGETQSSLDELIKRTRRKLSSTSDDTKNPAKIVSIHASMTDGVGAQQIAILLKQNKRLTMAMVLTKTGYGIKDAFLVPLQNMKDAKEMLDLVQASTDAGEIPPDTLNLLLEAALADGLENNSPPEPGFIDVIEACSLLSLRPQQTSLDKLLDHVDPERQIRDASKQKLGGWIMDETAYMLLGPVTMSWFEDCKEIRDAVEQSGTTRTFVSKVWKYLETRREFWARRFLQTALTYKESGSQEEWRLLASSAYGLMSGRPLKKIPLMEEVAETSMSAATTRHFLK